MNGLGTTKGRQGTGISDAIIALLMALVVRLATLGGQGGTLDDLGLFQVGQAIHDGRIPYVDLAVQRPLVHVLIYWLMAAIPTNSAIVGLIDLAVVAATAWILIRIAKHWVGHFPALMSGLTYLVLLKPLDGFGGYGQTYSNLLMAGAALALIGAWKGIDRDRLKRRYIAAMALAGLAFSISLEVFPEALLFLALGPYWLWRRGDANASIAGHAIAGALFLLAPLLAGAIWYANHGWIAQWYDAMVSGYSIGLPSLDQAKSNAIFFFRHFSILLGTIGFGLVRRWPDPMLAPYRRLLLGWLGLAGCALLLVPGFAPHEALPLAMPVAVIAALGFVQGLLGIVMFLINFGMSLVILGPVADSPVRTGAAPAQSARP